MAHPSEPHCGYWGTLRARGRDALIAIGSRSMFAAGNVLLPQHDNSGDVLIIWSGLVKAVVRAAGDRCVVLALRGAGDIIGELANLTGGRRSAAVVAVNGVDALRIGRTDFTRFLEHHPGAADSLHRTVVSRLCEADRDRLAAASMTVGQRLARLLLKVARRYGVPAPDGGLRIDQLSQDELAACIGGAQRTVAREMGLWRTRHIISTERRSVTVHEPSALERIAGRNAPPP